MKEKARAINFLFRLAATYFICKVLIEAANEYFEYAWGYGSWLGGFTLNGAIGLIALVLAWAMLFALIMLRLWLYDRTIRIEGVLSSWRNRLGPLCGLIIIIPLLTPLWFMQYSRWGGEFIGLPFRLVVFLVSSYMVCVLLTRSQTKLVTLPNLAISILLVTSGLIIGSTAAGITDYPFSLTWSEGNRMWDYSVLFGRAIYDYPSDRPIFAYLDLGRQSLWGLPFLLPNVSIMAVRAWNAFLLTIPYAIFGWIVFMKGAKLGKLWMLAGLWSLAFMSQGPIYTPLVLGAIFVAIAWFTPHWMAFILIAVAGYYLNIGRYTWIFAPAMWASMIYFGVIKISVSKFDPKRVMPAVGAVLAGLFGGYVLPRWQMIFQAATSILRPSDMSGQAAAPGMDIVSVEGVSSMISRQPLLWGRLLPNPTYELGILLGLLVATLPCIIYLFYLLWIRRWQLDWLPGLIILMNLLLFLGVGIIISVKIGGGSNLHNLDMFLIGLVFASALAWASGGYQELTQLNLHPKWIQSLMVVMFIFFAYPSLRWIRPINLPPADYVDRALNIIRKEVANANEQGEILFLDQRQLLTFGYVQRIPLVPEYEKKLLMDNAMAGDAQYFEQFYQDLEIKRFALIVSEPLFTRFQGSDYQFGVENDAWVSWVSKKILCYYKPLSTFQEVRVQLLLPREGSLDCK